MFILYLKQHTYFMLEIARTTERTTIPPTTEVSNSTANESSAKVADNRFPSNFSYTFYHLFHVRIQRGWGTGVVRTP